MAQVITHQHGQLNNLTEEAFSDLPEIVELLQHQAGGTAGYRLRRIILTNFWLYQHQEFEFPHGRLYLAGENASGKSTVLMAALPLVLDGEIRPHRLDTFGGKEKRIDYYVLGSENSATPFHYEKRTAYVALEFEWLHPTEPPYTPELRQHWRPETRQPRFLTIGLSFAGNSKNADPIRVMRFLITDGTRLEHDIPTYSTADHGRGDTRATDHATFRKHLEGHGIICEGQGDYERQVALHLFGITEHNDFQNLLDLLLLLRRPNLSSDLTFSRVSDYLKQSLRRIPDETTARVTGTIAEIDRIMRDRDQLRDAYAACERIYLAGVEYALAQMRMAASDYLDAQLGEDEALRLLQRYTREMAQTEELVATTTAALHELTARQSQLGGQIAALENSEGLQVADRLAEARQRLHEATADLQGQEQNLAAARDAIRDNQEHLERSQRRFRELHQAWRAHLTLLEQQDAEVLGADVTATLVTLRDATQHVALTTPVPLDVLREATRRLADLIQQRQRGLGQLVGLHQRHAEAERQAASAQAQEVTAGQEMDDSYRQFQQTLAEAQTGRDLLVAAITQPIGADVFPGDLVAWNDAQPALAALPAPEDAATPEVVVAQMRDFAALAQRSIRAINDELTVSAAGVEREARALQATQGVLQRDLADTEARYQRELAEPELRYIGPSHREASRAVLAQQGIAAYPLYMLVDLAPDLAPTLAGRLEAFLEDAGLLDALVVLPTQRQEAERILRDANVSDVLLDIPSTNTSAGQATLAQWLVSDPLLPAVLQEREWQAAIQSLLTATPGDERVGLAVAGDWRHGWLHGYAASGEDCQYIGTRNRQRRRQAALDTLQQAITALRKALEHHAERVATFDHQREQMRAEQLRLQSALAESQIAVIVGALERTQQQWARQRERFQTARAQAQEAARNQRQIWSDIEWEAGGFGAFAYSAAGVQQGSATLREAEQQVTPLTSELERIGDSWQEHDRANALADRHAANIATVTSLYESARARMLHLQEQCRELERIVATSAVADIVQRLSDAREALRVAAEEEKILLARVASASTRLENVTERHHEADMQHHAAYTTRLQREEHLTTRLAGYPAPQLQALHERSQQGATLAVAREQFPDASRAMLAAQRDALEATSQQAYIALSQIFTQESQMLIEFGPSLEASGMVIFADEQRADPAALLGILAARLQYQETLLTTQERRLFEDYLLQEIADAIRIRMLEAEEWVQHINAVLDNIPIVDERYTLEWHPLPEPDVTKPGSHLARLRHLLRKPTQALTTTETTQVMEAFRAEIVEARARLEQDANLHFADILAQIFDYREWYQFSVAVTPQGGRRMRLTDRIAGTRSGAEQLFALYVPLFAALASLYQNAAPGAPRLLALDEAFDKASQANIERIMGFLVSQDFQWIMTGPRMPDVMQTVPVATTYHMLHEKGTPFAAATPRFAVAHIDGEAADGGEEAE